MVHKEVTLTTDVWERAVSMSMSQEADAMI